MDSLSLTSTIGPVLLKAASLAKLCGDIQAEIESAPTTLALISKECTDLHHGLERFQGLGEQDLSKLDASVSKELHGVINTLPECTDVLSNIEKHGEALRI